MLVITVVLIAVFLDRVTAALGAPGENRSSLLGMLARRRAPRDGGGGTASAPAPEVTAQQDAADEAKRVQASPRRAPIGGGVH